MSDLETELSQLGDRQRAEVLAAFSAVRLSADPVIEAGLPGLRDISLRRVVDRLLAHIGRTLVKTGPGRWTAGYADEVVDELEAEGWQPLDEIDRALLVIVLVHSVAIPRSQGRIVGDSWLSQYPTSMAELNSTLIGRGDRKAAFRRLRAAGLVKLAPKGAGYLPGPQLQRLTPRARRRLEEELVIAAAPDSLLATVIRDRRSPYQQGEPDA
jgi:hypothetical protein